MYVLYNHWKRLQNVPKYNLRISNFENFPGGMLPDLPSISMLHMLIMLCTVTLSSSNYSIPTFNYVRSYAPDTFINFTVPIVIIIWEF